MKTTVENNKLIAEFMDIDQVDIDQAYEDYGELRYHTSWDWLMPVVEKIDKLGYNTVISRISINISNILYGDNPIVSRVCGNISKKQEIVLEAVVEFIKWYNENKED